MPGYPCSSCSSTFQDAQEPTPSGGCLTLVRASSRPRRSCPGNLAPTPYCSCSTAWPDAPSRAPYPSLPAPVGASPRLRRSCPGNSALTPCCPCFQRVRLGQNEQLGLDDDHLSFVSLE